MKKYYFVSKDIKNLIFIEYQNIINSVDLKNVDKGDLLEIMYCAALDIIPQSVYFDAEDNAAKDGIRDYDIINTERDHSIRGIINTYLLKNKLINIML